LISWHSGLNEGDVVSSRIYESYYKDRKCLVLENETLCIRILPDCGGKIQSIYNKSKMKEYLYQSPYKQFKPPVYDSSYVDADFSGFDEMFPTISECYYPKGPWRGTRIPDHGEIWSVPWEYKLEQEAIFMAVYGVRFPYRFEKRIQFIQENTIQLSYKVINLSSFDFDFIWAAHPLFNCNENMVIVAPDSMHQIINTAPGEILGSFGTVHEWPVTHMPDGKEYDISLIRSESSKSCKKFYALGKVKEGWCALHDKKNGDVIGLSYPISQVPYLGFWINEGGCCGQYNVALEPCTGALDRLDTAVQWNQAAVLEAGSEYEWYLNMTFDNAYQFTTGLQRDCSILYNKIII